MHNNSTQDNGENLYRQAFFFYNDVSHPDNEFKAFSLFSQAAKQGHIPAQIALGKLYETGYGTDYNPKKSEYWYTKAVRQGSDEAMVNLAQLKIQGDIEADYEGAKALLERAVKKNNPDARALLEHLEENKPWNMTQKIAVTLIILSIIPWAMFAIPLVLPLLNAMGVTSIKIGFFIIIALAPAFGLIFLTNEFLGD